MPYFNRSCRRKFFVLTAIGLGLLTFAPTKVRACRWRFGHCRTVPYSPRHDGGGFQQDTKPPVCIRYSIVKYDADSAGFVFDSSYRDYYEALARWNRIRDRGVCAQMFCDGYSM
jgi:hypothetical protein